MIYKIITQKKIFSSNENVYENNKRKVNEIEIEADYFSYYGEEIDLDPKKKDFLNSKNIPYDNNKFYGPLKELHFIKNGIISEKIDVFGDPYWKLYKKENGVLVFISEHKCGFNIKDYQDSIK